MLKFSGLCLRLLRDVRGATSIEYALLAAFVAMAIVTSAATVGSSLSGTFSVVGDELASANTE